MAGKSKGWIKLHRQVRDNEIWRSTDRFDKRSAWIDILLSVNHEDRTIVTGMKEIVLQPGQMHTSIEHLAQRWNWNRKTVMDYLKLLEKLQMITTKRTTHGTTLTVVNWGFFQGDGTTDRTSLRTSDWTSERTSLRTQTRIIYNKNIYDKNERKNAHDCADSFSHEDEPE